jgi:aspartyl-tRNA(Asn)/glutamyl-tRNA(Gln) amidotransferase subunit A
MAAAGRDDLAFAPLVATRARVAAGEVTALEVARAAIDRIGSTDGTLNAFVRVDEEGALAAAAAIDRKRAAGAPLGPLAGVPIGVKDLIATKGLETTAASRILRGFVPPYDATVVERLRAADAVLVGKCNLDEFAMGSTNEHSAFGPCRNPWDPARVAGGSSGGSAAAVAAGQCAGALGTDTGGSIREPAAFCGVVGVKPTYGRVSRYGIIAFASSLDQCGPLARSVRDAAVLLGVLAGHDPRDATSVPDPVPPGSYAAALSDDVAGLRVGVPEEFFAAGLDPAVDAVVRAALAVLEGAGATLVPVALPHVPYAIAAYYVIANAEASSNLARYDGVRYGHRARLAAGEGVDALYARSRGEGFGAEVKRRIMLGTYALSAGYYDQYYGRAQRVRTLVRQDFERAFRACDVIAGPTAPLTAIPLGSRLADPLQMYLMDVYTVATNLAGLPALSLPCGFTAEGLPVGLHLQGPPLAEQRLLDVAFAYERRTDWHERRPPVSSGLPDAPPAGGGAP